MDPQIDDWEYLYKKFISREDSRRRIRAFFVFKIKMAGGYIIDAAYTIGISPSRGFQLYRKAQRNIEDWERL